jgi:hypothetical protein
MLSGIMLSWCDLKFGHFVGGIEGVELETMFDPQFLLLGPRIITDSYSHMTHGINIGT